MARKLVVALALTAGVCAQNTLVVPASHAAREGTGTTSVPFGRSTSTRVQCVYDGMLFPQPVVITGLALRLDGGTTAAAKQVDCEIRMGTLPASLLALSPSFAANVGPDTIVVLPQQVIALAGQSNASTPGPFMAPIPLAVPFAYTPASGPLVIDILVYQQTPGTHVLDTTFVCDSPELPIGPLACVPPVGVPLRVESATTQVIWGRPWVARVLDAVPGAVVMLALGTTETGTLLGQSLPADLAPLGAPGCLVSIDLAALYFGLAEPDGTAMFPFAIPNAPWAVGVEIRYQAGELRPAANPLGVITSQAHKVAVCGWEPVGRVWANQVGAGSGTREIGVAPVVRLTIQ